MEGPTGADLKRKPLHRRAASVCQSVYLTAKLPSALFKIEINKPPRHLTLLSGYVWLIPELGRILDELYIQPCLWTPI